MTTMSDKFSGLSIEDAEPPRTRITLAGHPVFEAFKSSAAIENRTVDPKVAQKWTGKAKAVTIASSDVIELEGIVRRSADQLNCGSGLRFRTPDDKVVEVVSVGGTENKETGRKTGGKLEVQVGGKPYTGEVKVWFWAKSRRAGKPAVAATAVTPTAASDAQAATVPTAEPQASVTAPAKAAPAKAAAPIK